METVLSLLKRDGPLLDKVIIHSRWIDYDADYGQKDVSGEVLRSTLVTLHRLGLGEKTVMVGPHQMYNASPLSIKKRWSKKSKTPKTLEEVFQEYFHEDILPTQKLLERVVSEFPEVTFMSGFRAFCSKDLLCKIQTDAGELAMRDWGHWTLAGMRMYGKMMREHGILEFH